MIKYLIIAIFLHLSLCANEVTCTPIFNNDIADLFNSEEDHDVTSKDVVDTDDSPPTTIQPASLYSSSDINLDVDTSTTYLPTSTENIENGKWNHNGSDKIDWKFAFVSFSLMILVITLCKCCTHCVPNLCEMCLDKAETRTIQQRERESTTTADNRCKTCHERIPHPWPNANNCRSIVAVLELEPISGLVPVLPPNLPPQIMSFPMDNEAFTNDSDIGLTDRARNCETPPPSYTASMSETDNYNRHGVNTVD